MQEHTGVLSEGSSSPAVQAGRKPQTSPNPKPRAARQPNTQAAPHASASSPDAACRSPGALQDFFWSLNRPSTSTPRPNRGQKMLHPNTMAVRESASRRSRAEPSLAAGLIQFHLGQQEGEEVNDPHVLPAAQAPATCTNPSQPSWAARALQEKLYPPPKAAGASPE